MDCVLEQLRSMCMRSEAAATHSQKFEFQRVRALGVVTHEKVIPNNKGTRGPKDRFRSGGSASPIYPCRLCP